MVRLTYRFPLPHSRGGGGQKSGGNRRGAGRCGDMAELHHHSELVRDSPVLDDLSVLDPHNIDHFRECLDPSRWVPCEAAEVGAAASLPSPDLVAGNHDFVDRDLEVGECRTQVLDRVLRSFDPIACTTLVLAGTRGYELVDGRQVALVETLVDHPAVDRLVRNR